MASSYLSESFAFTTYRSVLHVFATETAHTILIKCNHVDHTQMETHFLHRKDPHEEQVTVSLQTLIGFVS